MTTVISVENLSKLYRLGTLSSGTLSHDLNRAWARMRGKPDPLLKIGEEDRGNHRDGYIWALRDVSFEVKEGEVLGIIGRNGAGKSTLLKILSRVTAPTSGQIKVKGRVASLLEVGTGFHPELTGRENVFLNGAILGMSRREIARKFDEIVAFAEVEQFIDTPVKRYSSGMYVRLAFAVAAHLEPEILVVDEVLAVGDTAFQKKCLGKMEDVAKEGRTVLFVSHNMAAVQQLCQHAALIHQGELVELSSTLQVIQNYLASNTNELSEFRAVSPDKAPGKSGVKLTRVSIKDSQLKVNGNIQANFPFFIEIEYELSRKIDNLRVGYRLISGNGAVVFTSGDTDPDGRGTPRLPGRHISRCVVPENLLNSGRYYVTATCDRPMQEIHFIEENIVSFSVELIGGVGGMVPDGRYGVIRPALNWQIETISHVQ